MILWTGSASAATGDIADVTILFDEGWLDDAEKVLDQLISENPKDPELYYMLARVYLIRDDAASSNGGAPWEYLDEIEDHAKKAIELNPREAKYHVILGHGVGLKAMRGGKVKMYSRAKRTKQEYETAAELDPNDIDARTSLIQYHMQAPGIAGGDKQEARRLAQVVAAIDSAEGFAAWKTVYLHAEEYDALEAAIREVVEAHPEEKTGYMEYLRLCNRREQYDCVEKQIMSILAIDPADVDAYWYLSRLHQERGQYDDAEAALTRAIAIDPDDPYTYRWLADFYKSRERWNEAIEQYERALEVDPAYQRALYGIGETLVLAETDLDRAERCFNDYIASRLKVWWPERALAYCELAKINDLRGNRKAAVADIKKAKKLNPGNSEIRSVAKGLHVR